MLIVASVSNPCRPDRQTISPQDGRQCIATLCNVFGYQREECVGVYKTRSEPSFIIHVDDDATEKQSAILSVLDKCGQESYLIIDNRGKGWLHDCATDEVLERLGTWQQVEAGWQDRLEAYTVRADGRIFTCK